MGLINTAFVLDLIASPIANETISINITSDDQKDNNVSYTYEVLI